MKPEIIKKYFLVNDWNMDEETNNLSVLDWSYARQTKKYVVRKMVLNLQNTTVIWSLKEPYIQREKPNTGFLYIKSRYIKSNKLATFKVESTSLHFFIHSKSIFNFMMILYFCRFPENLRVEKSDKIRKTVQIAYGAHGGGLDDDNHDDSSGHGVRWRQDPPPSSSRAAVIERRVHR